MNEAGLSDELLSDELKKWTGTTPALDSVGELSDRHWEAAFAYARLCTDGPRAAGMLTTAAFTRLFGESLRHTGPSKAWRPQVLVAVRRIAAEWDAEGRRELLHPGLRSHATARLQPPPGRRLLSRAFQRVPQTSRAVLWHAEVEAEPLSVPAALLGLDEGDVRAELHRARERLREECLHVHRELAPEAECRSYRRMLDVTFRRGGVDIDADLREHLARCTHCSRTAGQLVEFNAGLGVALAEAVLGWGARWYAESRASRAERPAEPAPAAVGPSGGEPFAPVGSTDPTEVVHPGTSGARRATGFRGQPTGRTGVARASSTAASRRIAHRAARRARRRTLAAGVVTVSGLIVLPLLLWSLLGSGGSPAPRPGSSSSRVPGSPSPGASWADVNGSGHGSLHGRLRNLASGLCAGVVGEQAVQGAETQLTTCSTAPSQKWTYETDGLLRNSAAPDLCLDSHLGYSVRLAPCAVTGKAAANIRYAFTAQGDLVARWNQKLALAPAATDGSGALVLKIRTPGAAQRWEIDAARPDLRMQNVNWDAHRTSSSRPGEPSSAPAATSSGSAAPTAAVTQSDPAPTPSATAVRCPVTSHDCVSNSGGRHRGGRHRRR
ncbi:MULTISPECIES: ricin-type beta-trefoil lectin domain protein [Streptomyces]|uniref:ricin-type beta-trefoil lectin domain protein n=1 Tax=Streptomyces TaxID=1883 RepID=UPI000AFF6D84|nr:MULTISPECIES: ricin-type beta-trefoil lectin domain protein [Streptomyces]